MNLNYIGCWIKYNFCTMNLCDFVTIHDKKNDCVNVYHKNQDNELSFYSRIININLLSITKKLYYAYDFAIRNDGEIFLMISGQTILNNIKKIFLCGKNLINGTLKSVYISKFENLIIMTDQCIMKSKIGFGEIEYCDSLKNLQNTTNNHNLLNNLQNYLALNDNKICASFNNNLCVININLNDDTYEINKINFENNILNLLEKSDNEILIVFDSQIMTFNIEKYKIANKIKTYEPWLLSFYFQNRVYKFDSENNTITNNIVFVQDMITEMSDICFSFY